MRFLVDECLSTRVATLLTDLGHDAVHVVTLGLAGQPDTEVLARASHEHRVLVSADTDFGELLARSGDAVPSVILFRRSDVPTFRPPGDVTRPGTPSQPGRHQGRSARGIIRRDH